jgi:hypothetical protein
MSNIDYYKLFLFRVKQITYLRVYDISDTNVNKDIKNILISIKVSASRKNFKILKDLICDFSDEKCKKVYNNLIRKQKLKDILK